MFNLLNTSEKFLRKLYKWRQRDNRNKRVSLCLTDKELNEYKEYLTALKLVIKEQKNHEEVNIGQDLIQFIALYEGLKTRKFPIGAFGSSIFNNLDSFDISEHERRVVEVRKNKIIICLTEDEFQDLREVLYEINEEFYEDRFLHEDNNQDKVFFNALLNGFKQRIQTAGVK